ncbi:MAG: hypothetical protein RLY97_1493, partial [Pseudomonadota bacterium]
MRRGELLRRIFGLMAELEHFPIRKNKPDRDRVCVDIRHKVHEDLMIGLRIIEDDLHGAEIAALLELHLAEMRAWSPACSVHAMPIERLRERDVTFYSAWVDAGDGDFLAGCGALKQLDQRHGELKSMRAAPDYRGRGVGKA